MTELSPFILESRTAAASSSQPTPAATAPVYEAPELFEIGPARALLQGIVVTENYADCTFDGSTTRYPPRC